VLAKDPDFAKKVRPHLKNEYFGDDSDKVVYNLIEKFYIGYSAPPPKDSLLIELENLDGLNETVYSESLKKVNALYTSVYDYSKEWLISESEKFCRDRAIYNAIMHSVKIINGESKLKEGAIPDLLSKALSVGFDAHVGHDYFENAEDRYEFYNKKEERIKSGIYMLDKVTGGGFPLKTMTVLMASSGGGKSAVKCSIAADMIRNGVDVLYITMELAEERIAERIDANLMNIPISELRTIPEKMFKNKIDLIKNKTNGKLVIKEYPTSSATVDNFNALLEELKAKKGFVPKVVFVDYLQIVASASAKGSNVNTYQQQKSVAEELRGFAVKHNIALVTSVQTNRSGYNVSDMDETTISDSIAIVYTADLIVGIIRTDELKEQNQVLFKQIKNRFGDPSYFQKFLCGMDTSRMKVFDLENGEASADRFKSKKEKKADAEPEIAKPNSTKKVSVSDWDFGDDD
jgi:archaellum biogenesis ATPase FlaH